MTFTLRSTVRRPVLSTLTALALVSPAVAQQPAPAPAAVAVPPMACTKPSDFMPTFTSAQQLARFQKSLDVYKTCVMDYVHANSAKANDLVAQAAGYNDAANVAIAGFNAYMTELNEASKQAGEKSPATEGGGPKINP